MHVTPAVCNVYGTMHGGAFATVLDMATSTHMTLQLLDRQPPVIHVTSALQTRYYKAARDGDFLIGRTAMRRAGKRMIWCDMDFVPLAAMPVLRPRLVPAGNAAAMAAVEDEADVRKILADATRRRDWRLTWAPVLAPESSAATPYGATALSVLESPTDPHNAAGGLDAQSVADGDSDAALVSWPLLPVAEPLCSGTNTKAISVFDMSKFKVHAPN
jgi:acyl-coenzyme A thioesterase PaaI-like protein